MPTISFPSSPSLNDTYSFNGKTWIYNGSAWDLQSSGAINGIPIGNATPASGAFTTLSSSGNTTLGSILGNLVPQGNLIYDLGDESNYWRDLYLSGSSIRLGNIVLKNVNGSFQVFQSDGTTPAPSSTTSLVNGTSNVVVSASGNVTVASAGTDDVLIISSTGANVTGTFNATGNITGSNLSVTNVSGTLTTAAQPNITSVGTLSSLSAVGNIVTTGNITAGNISVSGNLATTNLSGTIVTATQPNITAIGQLSSLGVTGNITAGNISVTNVTGTLTTAAQPNITSIGTLTTLSVSGNVNVGSNINNTGSNGTGNIGSSTTYFNTVFAKATSAQYADLAEKYTADAFYESGTVVVFGGQSEITISTAYAQMNIAGVISTDPAYIMNAGSAGFAVALQGRVPCRVMGTIRKGDLVTSSEIEGVATRLDPTDWVPGSVIGKALENYDSNEVGVIEVVVGRV